MIYMHLLVVSTPTEVTVDLSNSFVQEFIPNPFLIGGRYVRTYLPGQFVGVVSLAYKCTHALTHLQKV